MLNKMTILLTAVMVLMFAMTASAAASSVRFGIISDTHIGQDQQIRADHALVHGSSWTPPGGWENFDNSYKSFSYLHQDRLAKVLDWYSTMNIDALAITGDMVVGGGDQNRWNILNNTLNGRLSRPDLGETGFPQFLAVMGNHERGQTERFTSNTGQSPNSVRVINGYHFITFGNSQMVHSIAYPSSEISWLQNQINAAKAADPAKPIFVFMHPIPERTVAVSEESWSTTSFGPTAANCILRNEPRVVLFAGHIHTPNNDPRTIWQGGFTAIETGTTYYFEMEGGGDPAKIVNRYMGDNGRNHSNANIANVRQMGERGVTMSSQPKNPIDGGLTGPAAQGVLVDVSGTEITITFWDFDINDGRTGNVYQIPQTFKFDVAQGAANFPYTNARRITQRRSPVFDATRPITAETAVPGHITINSVSGSSIDFTFNQPLMPNDNPGGDIVHSYEFEIWNGSNKIYNVKQWSDFMWTERLQKPTYNQFLAGLNLSAGVEYELRIYAYSSFAYLENIANPPKSNQYLRVRFNTNGAISDAGTPAVSIVTQPAANTTIYHNRAGYLRAAAIATFGATPSYQWFSNTTNSNTGGTAIQGATAAIFNIPTGTTGRYYYYCRVSAGSAAVNSNVAAVNVAAPQAPVINIRTQPERETNISRGGDGFVRVAANFSSGYSDFEQIPQGALSFQWYRNTEDSNTGGSPVSGATEWLFSVPTEELGRFYYYCKISVTNFAGSASINSDVAVVNITERRVVNYFLPFDGSIANEWGPAVNHNGTPVFVNAEIYGVSRQAIHLGQGRNIEIPEFDYNQPFTLAFWVQNRAAPSVRAPIVSNKDVESVTFSGLSIYVARDNIGNTITLGRGVNASNASPNFTNANNNPALNQWRHIAVVRQANGNVRMYTNAGNPATTSGLDHGPFVSDLLTLIGSSPTGNSAGADFYMADFVLTSGAMTEDDIRALFEGERPSSINNIKKPDKRHGIRFAKNPASDNAEISVILPNNERAVETKIVVYDMTGNVVHSGASTSSATGKAIVWDLRNSAGRFVANGTYLVVAEVKSANGKVYAYSARLGVKRQ